MSSALREAGHNPEGDGIEACVRQALKPKAGRFRPVLDALGAEDIETAVKIANEQRKWLDDAGHAFIRAGVAAADGERIDPIAAVLKLHARHLAEITRARTAWQQERDHDRARATQRLQSDMARERDARAAVQVKLDDTVKALKTADYELGQCEIILDSARIESGSISERVGYLTQEFRERNVAVIDLRRQLHETAETLNANRAELAALREGFDTRTELLAVARAALETVRAEFYDMTDEQLSSTDMGAEVFPAIVARLDAALSSSEPKG